jgi:endonuclease-3
LNPLEQRIARLRRFYGLLPSPPSDPFILFVWSVLASHSTPARRDAALSALKKIRLLTPDAMWRAPQKQLEEAVKVAGPYLDDRVRSLRTGVDVFRKSPKLPQIIRGPLPAARRALEPLSQLGEGGARRMLLFAAGRLVLPVDADVDRVGRRLGYGSGATDFRKSSRSVQRAMTAELPHHVDAFRRAFVYLSHHGAATCTERDPHCPVCPLLEDCETGRVRSTG